MMGHLDMIRSIPRIFRRAGISVNYSQGFHPKPLFSFGPALSLGAAALFEPLEVILGAEIPEEELLRRLNDATTVGFAFVSARRICDDEPRLHKITTTADYVVALEGLELPPGLCDVGGLDARCAEIVDAATLPFVRQTRKGEKSMDLAAAIVELHPTRVEDPRLPFEGLALAMRLRVDLGWMARPTEIVATVLGRDSAVDVLQARLGIWGDKEGQRTDLVTGQAIAPPMQEFGVGPEALAVS